MRHALVALVLALSGCASGGIVDASVPVAGADPPVTAHVRCTKAKGEALECHVSHDGAGRCAICWVVELDCKNQRHLRAEACDEVAPGTELDHVLDEIPDRARCDAIESGAVTSAWTRDCSS